MKTWAWSLGIGFILVAACTDVPRGSLPSKRDIFIERFHDSGPEVPCPSGAGDAKVIQEKREYLKSHYSISVDLAPHFQAKDKVEFDPIKEDEMAIIQVYLTVAVDQLQKHSPEFFKAAQIKSFAYVKAPVVEGTAVAGLALYDDGQLMFSVDTENCAVDNIADTLHHEMFHFFHGNPEPPLFKDADWESLNEKGFKYESTGDKDTEVNHPKPGFVSEYAMAEMGEDIAETFAAIMLGGTARLVEQWSHDDKVLASKVAFVKAVMAKTSPLYNEAYWEKILHEPEDQESEEPIALPQ